jgi:molybdopterin/thiamine biosynthesis adenylyltransferase
MNVEIQTRFKDAPFYKPDLEIIIAGLGGIGSYTSYSLCRQGYTMFLYDFDTVEIHNIGSQLYGLKDIGKSKESVAKEIASIYGGNDDIHLMGKFTEDSPISNIVLSCFDNMSSRKLLFNKWLDYQLSKDVDYKELHPNEINIFIDGRMDAQNFQVYSVKSLLEAEEYKKTLFDDADIPDLPCSYKATAHTGMMIASTISTILLNHIANKISHFAMREVPFATTYSNELMNFETFDISKWKKS